MGDGWVDAAGLCAGQFVSGLKGGSLTVKSVVADEQQQDTYNFEVADYHTYFVGERGAFVHNVCGGENAPNVAKGEFTDLRTLVSLRSLVKL